jgi:hypothetical protein
MADVRGNQETYARFIADLADFLIEAGLATASTLVGCTERELSELASWHTGAKLPAAYAAYLRAMGYRCGSLWDPGEGIGLDERDDARRVAARLTAHPQCQWRLTDSILPIGQYQAFQLLFMNVEEGDDPRVFRYMERHPLPKVVGPTFTAWLREVALGRIEAKPALAETLREISRHREHWSERKRVLDGYAVRAREMREALIERVAVEDAQRGRITGPSQFQSRWVEEFARYDLWPVLKVEGQRMPWGWVRPGEAAREVPIP